MTLRILHLIPSISALRGGPSNAVLSMAASLLQEGVDASILTTNDHGPSIQAGLPLGRWHEQEALGQAVPVLAFARWSPPHRSLREFAISPGLNRWLGAHASNYDLIHVHALFSCTTSLGMAQLRRQGLPYILRTIGQLNRWSMSQSILRKRLFLKLVDRANLEGAAALHFTSKSEQEEAASLNLETTNFVLPLGVSDLNLPAPKSLPSSLDRIDNSRSTHFLFLSRLHPVKQLPILFDALFLLKKRCPFRSWYLSIAGDGDPSYICELRQRALELEISDRLHWHGFVAGATKQALLQQADWFVLPSASESFGIAAAEALMLGTPVVLSPGVALASEVEAAGAGLIVNSTPEALSACLELCLEPPSASMRSAARLLAKERYGWQSISRNLIQYYYEVLRG
jgi:glycosyltransferase involved in cell wall biosynthesis